jgi:RHS repeat-associated protein
VTITLGATTLDGFTYSLGPAGNRVAVAEHGGRVVTYGHDPLYRLTGETISGDPVAGNNGTIAYTYDAVGNRLTRTSTVGAVPSTTDGYDANDRLASDDHDNDGNTIAANGTAYTYGRDLVSQQSAAGTTFYGHDGHGSVRLLTDGAGVPVERYRYDAFGTLLQPAGIVDNVYRYAGEQLDPDLNLVYLRARYMDPATGRFRTMDPHPGALPQPLSLHKYLYAHASPVDNLDPSGLGVALAGLAEAAGVLAIIGILGTTAYGLATRTPGSIMTRVRNAEVSAAVISAITADTGVFNLPTLRRCCSRQLRDPAGGRRAGLRRHRGRREGHSRCGHRPGSEAALVDRGDAHRVQARADPALCRSRDHPGRHRSRVRLACDAQSLAPVDHPP